MRAARVHRVPTASHSVSRRTTTSHSARRRRGVRAVGSMVDAGLRLRLQAAKRCASSSARGRPGLHHERLEAACPSPAALTRIGRARRRRVWVSPNLFFSSNRLDKPLGPNRLTGTMNFIGHIRLAIQLRVSERMLCCAKGYWGKSLPQSADCIQLEGMT